MCLSVGRWLKNKGIAAKWNIKWRFYIHSQQYMLRSLQKATRRSSAEFAAVDLDEFSKVIDSGNLPPQYSNTMPMSQVAILKLCQSKVWLHNWNLLSHVLKGIRIDCSIAVVKNKIPLTEIGNALKNINMNSCLEKY